MSKEGYRDRHYGLRGQTVRVRSRNEKTDRNSWNGMEVPVKITAEHPAFLRGTVMPHRNPYGMGISKPYPITITKHDIYTGEMIINGGSIR